MVLVVGATGQLGGRIARSLLHQGRRVRILVRSVSAYEALVDAGAEAVTGDLKEPDSLRAACAGVEAVVTTANSTARGGEDTIESVDRDGNRNLIEAAEFEGVSRFVFTSALGADPENPLPLLQAKGQTEQRLRASRLGWTLLQPNLYMDILMPMVVGGPAIAGEAVTLVREGRRRHSMVAMRDVVAYAEAVLDREDAVGKTLRIGGPEPVSWRDVVAAFEQELGSALELRTVAPGVLVPGLPEFASQLLAALETYESPMDVSELASTYGVAPTPLATFVRGFLGANRLPAA